MLTDKTEAPMEDAAHSASSNDHAATADYRMGAPAVNYASTPRSRNTSNVTNYLFGSSGSFERPAWSDTAWGRAKIRMVSRGIVGAAFFTLGGHYATKVMKNYEPNANLWKTSEGPWHNNILRGIAKGIDAGPGKIISHLFGPESVRFRERNQYHDPVFLKQNPYFAHPDNQGRSLGYEIVVVTFDFFMASIGDALTRNIVQMIDPNVRQSFILDKDGHPTTRDNGTFHFGLFLKEIGRTGWRVLTKNAGEDWAAALPYVYQMKWQRQAINNIGRDPNSWLARNGISGAGFKRSSDSNINGAVVSLNPSGEVAYSFQWQGALDLQARFSGYNWYTLMYREGYDKVGKALSDWHKSGFALSMPHIDNPFTTALDGVSQLARYVTKSFIKANLYMQPAVIPFWLMRVPQTAWRGQYEMVLPAQRRDPDPTRPTYRRIRLHDPVHGAEYGASYPRAKLINDKSAWPPASYHYGQEIFHGNPQPDNPNFFKNITNPYDSRIKGSWFDKMVSPFGIACYKTGSALTHAVDNVVGKPGAISKTLFGNSSNLPLEREKLLRNFVDASFSYTPYMWLKAETALHVDDRKNGVELGNMDKSLYSLIDHAATLNLKEAWKDVKKVAKLATNEEREIIYREGGMPDDASANDTAAKENPTKPSTMIDARSIHQKSAKKQQTASNDNPMNDNQAKKWVKVANGGMVEKIQPDHAQLQH